MKPLEGLRVVDFGIITAGASTSAILADLGAEVIKVEGPRYIDPFRQWAGAADHAEWWNVSPHFHFTNRNKKNICVDLKSPLGRELLLDLVGISDVVIENFRAGVLDRLGLGFDALKKANERIVLGSISSQGITGPEAAAASFGSTLEASSGLADFIRYSAEERPHISGQALNYPDQVVSLFAAGMIMSTVLEVRRTGRPYHVDISQREVSSFLIGEKLVAAAHDLQPSGATGAPCVCQGLYRASDANWVAVTVQTQEIAVALTRKLDVEVLDETCLSDWIGERSAGEAVRGLREAGAAASMAFRINELPSIGSDETTAFAHEPGGSPVKGLPWRLEGNEVEIRCAAPALGGDNRSVVVDLLKHSDETYRSLVAEGVLANAPAPV